MENITFVMYHVEYIKTPNCSEFPLFKLKHHRPDLACTYSLDLCVPRVASHVAVEAGVVVEVKVNPAHPLVSRKPITPL